MAHANELRKGTLVNLQGRICSVTYWNLWKSDRRSRVQMKFKDIQDGRVSETTAQPDDKLLTVEPPQSVIATVAETTPPIKGVLNGLKDAVLDNGMTVKVGMVINIGDRVRINTETGEYKAVSYTHLRAHETDSY